MAATAAGGPVEEEEGWREEEEEEAPSRPGSRQQQQQGGGGGVPRRMLPMDYLKKYPLHRAVETGSTEDMKLLLIMQPSLLNAVTMPLHRTAAMEAARLRNHQVLAYLAHAGADLNKVDVFGNSVLHYAAMRGCLATVEMLVQDYKMRVNSRGQRGMTALHHASSGGYTEMVRWLLMPNQQYGKGGGAANTIKGADPTVEDEEGRRPSGHAWRRHVAGYHPSKYLVEAVQGMETLLKAHEAKWDERARLRTARLAATTKTRKEEEEEEGPRGATPPDNKTTEAATTTTATGSSSSRTQQLQRTAEEEEGGEGEAQEAPGEEEGGD